MNFIIKLKVFSIITLHKLSSLLYCASREENLRINRVNLYEYILKIEKTLHNFNETLCDKYLKYIILYSKYYESFDYKYNIVWNKIYKSAMNITGIKIGSPEYIEFKKQYDKLIEKLTIKDIKKRYKKQLKGGKISKEIYEKYIKEIMEEQYNI